MKIVSILLSFLFILLAGCVKRVAPAADAAAQKINSPLFHQRIVGASARELLGDDPFTSLKVEIQYTKDFGPDKEAIEHLRSFLFRHLHKPGGIFIVTKEIPAVSDTLLTTEQIMNLEKANRTAFSTAGQIAVYFLYTNSRTVKDNLLGMAYRNTSAVIFGKTVREHSDNFRKISRTRLEATLLLHEMGHMLGLVNTGTAMQTEHKDSEAGKHCHNKNCLMYYAPAKKNPFLYLLNYKIPELDEDCAADLKAYGGK